MDLEIVPTGGPLGAEVKGVDLSRDPGPQVISGIMAALGDHLLLLFRSQNLTRERLLGLADWFGGAQHPRADEPALGDESLDPIVIVSNVDERGVLGSGPVASHADQEYLREPSPSTLLYAVEVPPTGGETSWSNLLRAYDELPARVKRRVNRLERWSQNPYAGGRSAIIGATGSNQRFSEEEYPDVTHPLTRVQRDTGRRALCVSSITTGISGIRGPWAAWRTRRLLRRLKRQVEQPNLYYTHRWKAGDFVMWDNLLTIHKRAAFDGSQRRVMYRCQIAGARAISPAPIPGRPPVAVR